MSAGAIQHTCLIYDVRPIPPDRVENLTITGQEAIPQSDSSDPPSETINRVFITLWYTWRAPRFVGEGITGYQAWLGRTPVGDQTGNLQQIGLTNVDVLRRVFETSNTNFTLYFQVRRERGRERERKRERERGRLASEFIIYMYLLYAYLYRSELYLLTLRVSGLSLF